MNLSYLKKPFPENDVEWRIGRCGKKGDRIWATALAYITARAIHDRLDDVCGPERWQLTYKEHLNETICEIGIKCDNEWVWKSGGGDQTQFEAFKGGLSSAEKRAGVPWGIGRYLYKLDEVFVKTSITKPSEQENASVNEWKYQSKNDKKNVPAFYWQIPKLPKWALPGKIDKEWLKEDTKEFNLAKGAIAKGIRTIDDIKKVYHVTESIGALLCQKK